jgi:hypothetical protein
LHGRAAILAGGDGRFLFPDLPPGSFFVYATKGGYAEGASGRRRPGGTAQAIELTPAARSADVVIRMWKYGAITGTVTDEAGEPVVGLTVRLLLRTRPGMPPAPTGPGFVSLQLPYANAGVPTLTDDRGIYRFANLADGDYLVIASPPLVSAARNTIGDAAQTGRGSADLFALMGASAAAVGGRGFAATSAPLEVGETIVSAGRGRAPVIPSGSGRIRVYPPTFYPAAIIPAQAATVTVTAGAERAGIDIALAPVPAARVTGMLLDRDGPVATTSLHLVPAGAEGMPQNVVAPTSVTDAAGTFVFTAIPAGQYRLRGSAPRGLATVDLPVAVGGEDVDGLTVTPTSPPKITATLQFDGTTSPPSGTGGRGPLTMPAFLLDAVDGASGADQLVEVVPGDRSYTLSGYSTGRYRVRVPNSPAGWMFKAALLNGVDVSETPFDLAKDVPDLTLVFTDRWTGVSGVVQGTAADAATVLAFPTDARRLFHRRHSGRAGRRLVEPRDARRARARRDLADHP